MRSFKARILQTSTLLCLLALHNSTEAQTARGIGSGILYPAPNLATVMNPAAIVDSPALSVLGLYRFDPETPFASITGSGGFWGAGASYRQEGESTDVIEASLGLRSTFIIIGGTFRKVNDQEANGDAALIIDLGVIRLGGVLRDVDGGADRLDAGLGIRLGENAYLEFDVKKGRPWSNKTLLADAAIVLHAHDWTVGLGYDFILTEDRKIEEGEVHAGISLMLTDNLYVDTHYRLHNQEWNAPHWSAGARLLF